MSPRDGCVARMPGGWPGLHGGRHSDLITQFLAAKSGVRPVSTHS